MTLLVFLIFAICAPCAYELGAEGARWLIRTLAGEPR